jgi:hypothetical protein
VGHIERLDKGLVIELYFGRIAFELEGVRPEDNWWDYMDPEAVDSAFGRICSLVVLAVVAGVGRIVVHLKGVERQNFGRFVVGVAGR